MITHINGNLVEMAKSGYFDVIVHGCNCYCKMKKGIAKSIADYWPSARVADETFPIPIGKDRLGKFSFTTDPTDLTIVNAYTQLKYWYEPWENKTVPLVSYDAIRQCFTAIRQLTNPWTSIGIPLIGSGLAKGDWNIILPIITDCMEDRDLTVVHFSG